jgi:nicotinamidase-related amidase
MPGGPVRKNQPDLLICMDMQKEQLISRHGFASEGLDQRLSRCRDTLDQWRKRQWPVVHLKLVAQAAWFNPASTRTDWIDGWTPVPGEDVFEHALPSAYSSQRFSEFMDNLSDVTCRVVGFGLEETILATVVDALHRGHDVRVVEEAVFSKESAGVDEASYRKMLFSVIENFSLVETASGART